MTTIEHPPTPDLEAVKAKQQATWATGDYAVVGTTLQIVGERLCEALDVHAGERVLDVAAGNGNVSLAAARRFCDVTSTDYVPSLLERGRARADAEGLSITFRQADAEALPFAAGAFDVATSSFGVMFTADQRRAASELLRVVRPGGRIGLANWTPQGFVGRVFKTIGSFVPPPAGVRSPAEWGTEARLAELFADARSIDVERHTFAFRYGSTQAWVDTFRTFYGPMNRAFAALDGDRQAALNAALVALADDLNVADDGTMVVPSEYLEVVVQRGD